MAADKKIDRRTVIKRVAVGVGAASGLPVLDNLAAAQKHQHGATTPRVAESAAKAPSFFNRHQYATITRLASLIIPTDETPGAFEAKVNEYIDLVVGESPFEIQKIFLDGMAWLDKASQQRYKKKFVNLPNALQTRLLTEISRIKNPGAVEVVQAKFFKAIKDMTIDGFYTSKIGIEELGYVGNTVLDEFPGCTHPEHRG
ncbi:MAG: gluconate 2-dehydrogenase subunit 3 family protein [Acidimicrobiia bacterium]|nr:gluconate 2-dehydrogenase subunit 3 family protein [Acidimicrobiia bacterium]